MHTYIIRYINKIKYIKQIHTYIHTYIHKYINDILHGAGAGPLALWRRWGAAGPGPAFVPGDCGGAPPPQTPPFEGASPFEAGAPGPAPWPGPASQTHPGWR